MAYQSKHTGSTIDKSIDTVQQILNIIYPVGAVYISVNDVSPASFIGGTWEQLKDRFLLGAGTNYTAGNTGGQTNHTHTTGSHTLTTAEMPAHTHTRGTMNITGGFAPWAEGTGGSITQPEGAFYSIDSNQYGWGTTNGRDNDNEYIKFDASRSWTGETSSVGSGQSHSHGNTGSSSNMPPYLVVYMWKRIS